MFNPLFPWFVDAIKVPEIQLFDKTKVFSPGYWSISGSEPVIITLDNIIYCKLFEKSALKIESKLPLSLLLLDRSILSRSGGEVMPEGMTPLRLLSSK